MLVPLSYHLPAMFGSAAERAALFDDIRARGILETSDLTGFVDTTERVIEDAETRAEAARAEARHGFKSSMSAAELASVEAKITAAFDELICRHPKLSDELRDTCLLLILEVR